MTVDDPDLEPKLLALSRSWQRKASASLTVSLARS